ncbi:hypothetical protein FCL47_12170 [Desulfopila sp. IMCC35006]|uniref:hypothetical protein n=1 Tax=Desulfopila sp. IMCC35006 TaxID=2569542 RepID=UPI0010ACE51D|nr:hypothetical protein [Desulfopila sp. IMCC35006]TKB25848.1 hypothetical protein FCL47_12170 [Desulfopila sp. IMCC35006]
MVASEFANREVIEMSPDERGVYAQAAHSLVHDEPANAPVRLDQLLAERRLDDNNKDLWTTFNVVNKI